MSAEEQGNITHVLNRITSGEAGAEDALLEMAYHELRAFAAG